MLTDAKAGCGDLGMTFSCSALDRRPDGQTARCDVDSAICEQACTARYLPRYRSNSHEVWGLLRSQGLLRWGLLRKVDALLHQQATLGTVGGLMCSGSHMAQRKKASPHSKIGHGT